MSRATGRIPDIAVRPERARMGIPGASGYHASGVARARSRAARSARKTMVAGARRARSAALRPDGLYCSRSPAYMHRLRGMAGHFRRSLMLGPRDARHRAWLAVDPQGGTRRRAAEEPVSHRYP